VPLGVEFAEYEIAQLLINDPTFFEQASTGSNERLLQAGPVKIEFFSSTLSGPGGALFPPQVMSLLGPYLGSTSTITVPYVGGTLNTGAIIPREGYLIDEGL
jgi:hypothetical protein